MNEEYRFKKRLVIDTPIGIIIQNVGDTIIIDKNNLKENFDEYLEKVEDERDFRFEKPEEGDEYYYINSSGETAWDVEGYLNAEESLWDIGNVFNTRGEAESHLEWQKARMRLMRRIHAENKKANGGKVWKPDWKDRSKLKYTIGMNLDREELFSSSDLGNRFFQEWVYMKTREIADCCLEECKEDWDIYLEINLTDRSR